MNIIRKTLDTYAAWIVIAYAIVCGFFWPVLGTVLALTAVACVCCLTWYGLRALSQRVRRWQAERSSRAEIARRRTLGY